MCSVGVSDITEQIPPWDELLIEDQDPTSLVSIARERRLVLEDRRGPQWVDLCWVDEVALALIDLAVSRGQSIDLVYPAPAGQVAVLLAAQLLLHQFLRHIRSPSLGLVTADTTMATRTWEALRISTTGSREPLTDVFPPFRAGPDGESPWGGRRLQGLIIGQRCDGWPVDLLVVDHLAGRVNVRGDQPSAEIFSDPLDPALRRADEDGHLIWGWSEGDLARWNTHLKVRQSHTVPFSVASDRLETMAHGVDVTISITRHPEAEAALGRVREDLRLLRTLTPDRSNRHVERGLSVAWHHLATLTSLPCAPQRFDRFAGIPPWAAQATNTFQPELSAWARTLSGDFGEFATVLASDMGDLRAALDHGNPAETALKQDAECGTKTLAVTRTRTASRALLDALGSDPDAGGTGSVTVCSIGRLHREGTWPRALMIGEPSPWDWHRLLSGLAPQLEVLTLGESAATSCVAMVSAVRAARDEWGGERIRARTWRALLASDPPPGPRTAVTPSKAVITVGGAEFVPEPDPFESLASLFELDPLDFDGEGPRSDLARLGEDGDWDAAVPAVEARTDRGSIFLEVGRSVEVRVGPKIVDRRPEQLEPGDVLLVGRRQGRVGLLEALEERLADRPDLLAARYLLDRYHVLVRTKFAESRLSFADLHREMATLGCEKTGFAIRSWVIDGATMAPRDLVDLRWLNTALDLGMSDRFVQELFAGVQRRRVFRRAAGRALAEAARGSTVVADGDRVDTETGLSIADLRDAIIEATVITVAPCDSPMPLTVLGRLEEP